MAECSSFQPPQYHFRVAFILNRLEMYKIVELGDVQLEISLAEEIPWTVECLFSADKGRERGSMDFGFEARNE